MRRIVVSAAVAMLWASSALATQQNTFITQGEAVRGQYVSCCWGNNLAINGSYSCPQPAGGHTFATSGRVVAQNGRSCWQQTCAGVNDPPPRFLQAVCVHQECDAPGTCFVDPNGSYIQQSPQSVQ